MKTMRTESVIVGIVILLLASLLLCYIGSRIMARLWDNGIERAAGRVNSEPTLAGIATYITNEIQVGMSRYETERVLQKIAPIEIVPGHLLRDAGSGYGPTSCDTINLKLTTFPKHVWAIIACYNAQGELVILHSADSENFPPLDIYAPSDSDGELLNHSQ